MSAHYIFSLSQYFSLLLTEVPAAAALSAVQVLRPLSIWQRGTQGHESEWCSTIHFILLLRLTTNLTEGWGLGP